MKGVNVYMLPNLLVTATENSTPGIATGFSTALDTVWSMFGSCINTFNQNPIMWLGAAFGAAGAIIGLVKRSTSVGRRRK